MRAWPLVALLSVPLAVSGRTAAPAARHVILFLADAGGLPTLNAASWHGYGDERRLFVQRMPRIGLSSTATASEFVTDSAAGMTAIVTGVRTHNGVLAMGPDAVRGTRDGAPLTTILDLAEQHGLSTGVISNDALTGATPAALYAKVNDRDRTSAIFRQAFGRAGGDGIDVMIGAGRASVARALAAEGATIDTVAAGAGRRVWAALDAVPANEARPVVLLDDQEFDLAAAIAMARQRLGANPRGSFLMVESDVHTDRVRRGLDRMVTFDAVIEATAGSVGDDTLVIFTADHSFDLRVHDGVRGQPLLAGTAGERATASHLDLPNVRMDDSHTGEEVLVAALGPGSDAVHGFLANTDLFHVMRAAFGWPVASGR